MRAPSTPAPAPARGPVNGGTSPQPMATAPRATPPAVKRSGIGLNDPATLAGVIVVGSLILLMGGGVMFRGARGG